MPFILKRKSKTSRKLPPCQYKILRPRSMLSEDLKTIMILLKEFTSIKHPFSLHELLEILGQPNFYLFVCRNEKGIIIGMASAYMIRTLIEKKVYFEHLVVDPKYRGKGIGKELSKRLIKKSREVGAVRIDLTSRPERAVAHALYRKLGFCERPNKVFTRYLTKKQ